MVTSVLIILSFTLMALVLLALTGDAVIKRVVLASQEIREAFSVIDQVISNVSFQVACVGFSLLPSISEIKIRGPNS